MILLVADVQNLFYASRDLYGSSARIDFRRLREIALNGRSEPMRCVAMVTQLKESLTDIIPVLQRFGFETRNRRVIPKQNDKGEDVDPILELLTESRKTYATVVVASGHGDYLTTYKKIKESGVRIEVLSFQCSLHKIIYDVVDRVHILDDSLLYEKSRSVSRS